MIDFAPFSLNVRQLHIVEDISFAFTVKKFQHELGEILLIVGLKFGNIFIVL